MVYWLTRQILLFQVGLKSREQGGYLQLTVWLGMAFRFVLGRLSAALAVALDGQPDFEVNIFQEERGRLSGRGAAGQLAAVVVG